MTQSPHQKTVDFFQSANFYMSVAHRTLGGGEASRRSFADEFSQSNTHLGGVNFNKHRGPQIPSQDPIFASKTSAIEFLHKHLKPSKKTEKHIWQKRSSSRFTRFPRLVFSVKERRPTKNRAGCVVDSKEVNIEILPKPHRNPTKSGCSTQKMATAPPKKKNKGCLQISKREKSNSHDFFATFLTPNSHFQGLKTRSSKKKQGDAPSH